MERVLGVEQDLLITISKDNHNLRESKNGPRARPVVTLYMICFDQRTPRTIDDPQLIPSTNPNTDGNPLRNTSSSFWPSIYTMPFLCFNSISRLRVKPLQAKTLELAATS